MTETEGLIILNAVEGLGNARIRKLIDCYGSAVNVLGLKEACLKNDQIIPADVIDNLINFPQDKFLKEEYNRINVVDVNVIAYVDGEYPAQLAEIPDAPVLLYVKGNLECGERLSIAIVGSRRASMYGLSVAEKFGYELAIKGVCVVSGLARGVDTAAHKGALKAHGKTIAVLGSGLNVMYPKENKELFEDIACNGAVISEFPMEQAPLPYNFPRRNRIISGLSRGVIVAEAAKRSGALITADFALEQGRDVFAVPGPIDRLNASGVNHLIQQGAKLIGNVDDVLEEYDAIGDQEVVNNPMNRIKDLLDLDKEEKELMELIDQKPIHIDALIQKSCSDVITTQKLLLQLELKKAVKQLPGKNFQRI